MAQLGCDVTTVRVQRRGGGPSSAQPAVTPGQSASTRNWSSVEWNRLLDDTSGAQIRVEGKALCCDWASKVEPWRDEIAIMRGNELVWCGPVTEVNWVGDELRIDCKDLSYWFNRRAIHGFHSYDQGTDLATVFNGVVADALSVDPSPNIIASAMPCGCVITEEGGRSYVPYQGYASDVINELSRTGIDWTMLGRTMIIGGEQIPEPFANPPRLVAKHFLQMPDVEKDGYAFANRWHVQGAGGGDAGPSIYGTNNRLTANEATYGVVERIATEPLIRDNNTAALNAQTRFAMTGQAGVPLFVKGGQLTQFAPLAANELVPGIVVAVGLGDCPPVNVRMRLTSVSGSVGPEHDWVAIGLEPMGETGDQ